MVHVVSGHVFVVNGDLTKIACDALLIPTDSSFSFRPAWKAFVEPHRAHFKWSSGSMLLLPPQSGSPDVWLGNIGQQGNHSGSVVFEDFVSEFVQAALSELGGRPDRERIYPWPRPRLAINFLGSEGGGAKELRGQLAAGLIRKLHELVNDCDVDILFVTFGTKPYAAAQRARRDVLAEYSNIDEGIDETWKFDDRAFPNLRQRAQELAQHALESQLVLFIGAGVSAGAGLPDWKGLLSRIAAEAEFEPDQIKALEKYDLRDQATVIETRLSLQGQHLRDRVAGQLTAYGHYSAAHGLLASLPSREAVTTNFDCLYEVASRISDQKLAVLPESPRDTDGNWLLKLHGTLNDPNGIVLTRSDFLNMPRQYGALMGLVQALLMMRHMMFVGYSLSDEDFHELMHEVRDARRGVATSINLGTLLTLIEDPIATQLWGADLTVVSMMPSAGSEADDLPTAARQLDIFLDLVGYLSATSAAFFLDESYQGLTDDEADLREKLLELQRLTEGAEPGKVAFMVRSFLDSMGAATRGASTT